MSRQGRRQRQRQRQGQEELESVGTKRREPTTAFQHPPYALPLLRTPKDQQRGSFACGPSAVKRRSARASRRTIIEVSRQFAGDPRLQPDGPRLRRAAHGSRRLSLSGISSGRAGSRCFGHLARIVTSTNWYGAVTTVWAGHGEPRGKTRDFVPGGRRRLGEFRGRSNISVEPGSPIRTLLLHSGPRLPGCPDNRYHPPRDLTSSGGLC